MVNQLRNLEINKISISKKQELDYFLFKDKVKYILFIIISSLLSIYIYQSVMAGIKSNTLKSQLLVTQQKTPFELIFLHDYKKDLKSVKIKINNLTQKEQQLQSKNSQVPQNFTFYKTVFLQQLTQKQREQIIKSSKIMQQQQLIYNLQLLLKSVKNDTIVIDNKQYSLAQIANHLKGFNQKIRLKAVIAVIAALNLQNKVKNKSNFINAIFQVQNLQYYEKSRLINAKLVNVNKVLKMANTALKTGYDNVQTNISTYSLTNNVAYKNLKQKYIKKMQREQQLKYSNYLKNRHKIQAQIAQIQAKINANSKVEYAIENLYTNVNNYNKNVAIIKKLEAKADKND